MGRFRIFVPFGLGDCCEEYSEMGKYYSVLKVSTVHTVDSCCSSQ